MPALAIDEAFSEVPGAAAHGLEDGEDQGAVIVDGLDEFGSVDLENAGDSIGSSGGVTGHDLIVSQGGDTEGLTGLKDRHFDLFTGRQCRNEADLTRLYDIKGVVHVPLAEDGFSVGVSGAQNINT